MLHAFRTMDRSITPPQNKWHEKWPNLMSRAYTLRYFSGCPCLWWNKVIKISWIFCIAQLWTSCKTSHFVHTICALICVYVCGSSVCMMFKTPVPTNNPRYSFSVLNSLCHSLQCTVHHSTLNPWQLSFAEYIMAMNLLILLTDVRLDFGNCSVCLLLLLAQTTTNTLIIILQFPNLHVPVSFPLAQAPYCMSCYNKIPGCKVFQS